jgi:hypothetical protein
MLGGTLMEDAIRRILIPILFVIGMLTAFTPLWACEHKLLIINGRHVVCVICDGRVITCNG